MRTLNKQSTSNESRWPRVGRSLRRFFGLCLVAILLAPQMQSISAAPQLSQTESPNYDDSKLGEFLAGDIELIDEQGKPVRLEELVDKPTILSLVYFECPGICTPLLNEVTDILGKTDLDPAETPFQLLTVSFEPKDTPELAAKKKHNYFAQLSRPFPKENWRFLTASAENIQRLTAGVGFGYKAVGEDYIHPGGIVVISPERKITRYFFGTQFLPFDFKMGVIEASKGRVMPTTARVLNFCYSFDPKGRKYVFNTTRVIAVVMLSSLACTVGLAFFFMNRSKRKGIER